MREKAKHNTGIWLLCAIVAAPLGCRKQGEDAERDQAPADAPAPGATDPNQPLAKIGDRVITLGEFQERINRQSPYVRGRYSSLEHKKEFLSNMIRFEVLAMEAERQGLDRDPDAIYAMKQVMVQKLMKAQFEAAMNPNEITDVEIKAYYDANPDSYDKPEEVRIAAIIMKSGAEAKKVSAMALGEEGSTNEGFRALVSKFSDDEDSKRVGGDLRYLARDSKEVPKAVITAAFSLTKTGDVAGPIKAGGKHYIIRQTGRRVPAVKPLEKVADEIRDRLYREKRRQAQRDYVDKLRQAATIEVFEGRLKDVKISPPSKNSSSRSAPPLDLPAMPADGRPGPPMPQTPSSE